MKIEDYKYEFNLLKGRGWFASYDIDNSFYPFLGYLYLNQLTRGDKQPFVLTNKQLIDEFRNSLEDNEFLSEKDNIFTFRLNKISKKIINYIKLRLKYSLILYKNFNIDRKNNIITFERLNDLC